jgi:glycosyltransferase involved in cell wall biosynthesis
MHLLGIRRRTMLYGDYVPDRRLPDVYSAADVVALPYRQDYSSVSAIVHQSAGMGKIPFCSRIAKFEEVAEHISPDLVAGERDVKGWAEGLRRILVDQTHAAEMSRRVAAFAEETSWERVGRMRLDLWDALAAGRAAA